MPDVQFYEAFEEEEAAIKKFLPKNVNAQFTWKTIQENGDNAPPAKLISIRTQSSIPVHWSNDIDGVLTRSQGHEHLWEFCKDIPCGYLDDYCSRAVAEQAITMMMALMRKLKKQIKNFDTFARDGLTGRECRNAKAFVIGVGHIGSEIVDLTKGMGMEVKGFDILKNVKGLSYVSLKSGMKWADVIFCALPLNDETNNLLGYSAFEGLAGGKIFVNISRGEISPATDLKRLLDEQILDAAGLDVFPNENLLAHCLRAGEDIVEPQAQSILELSKMDNVIFTPHNAFNTQEAIEQKASLSVKSAVQFIKKNTFPCPVTPQ